MSPEGLILWLIQLFDPKIRVFRNAGVKVCECCVISRKIIVCHVIHKNIMYDLHPVYHDLVILHDDKEHNTTTHQPAYTRGALGTGNIQYTFNKNNHETLSIRLFVNPFSHIWSIGFFGPPLRHQGRILCWPHAAKDNL